MIFTPAWAAWNRESQLAAEMIASGVTVLGRADPFNKAYYNQAFFLLSIGFERTGKIILLANSLINHNGEMPSESSLKKYRHNIKAIIAELADISSSISADKPHATYPCTSIHNSIIEILTRFAQSARYYNLDFMAANDSGEYIDPIREWYEDVCVPILDKHYTRRQQLEDQLESQMLSESASQRTFVYFSSETGIPQYDIGDLYISARKASCIQRWSRVYILQLARWFAHLISALERICVYQLDLYAVGGITEAFHIYFNSDEFFRTRKTWTIYRKP